MTDIKEVTIILLLHSTTWIVVSENLILQNQSLSKQKVLVITNHQKFSTKMNLDNKYSHIKFD